MKPFILSSLFLFASVLVSSAQQSSSSFSTDSSGIRSSNVAPGSKFDKRKVTKHKTNLLLSQSTGRNVAVYKEGYTSFPNGTYVIKDYMVKGSINLVCVTYGVASASGYINSGDSVKKYYLNFQDDDKAYREVPIVRIKSAMFDMSKAILLDMLGKDELIKSKIMGLNVVTPKHLKALVKLYNSKRS